MAACDRPNLAIPDDWADCARVGTGSRAHMVLAAAAAERLTRLRYGRSIARVGYRGSVQRVTDLVSNVGSMVATDVIGRGASR